MRPTTAWAAGCGGVWLLLNLATCGMLPSGLDDRNFEQKVAIGGSLQSLGGLFLVAAIVLILVTAYKNLFSKEAVRVDGDWNQASYGSNIVTRNSAAVKVSATYDASIRNSKLSSEYISSLRNVRAFLERANTPDAAKGANLIDHAEKEINKGESANSDLLLGSISRAVSIAEKIAPAVGPIADAISKLKEVL